MQFSFDIKSPIFFIIFTFVLAFAFQLSAQDKMPKIIWKNLQEKYVSFEDVKPILENQSDSSVFLARIYPLWSARLLGFNEQTQKWENKLDALRLCYTVEDALSPIEIRSQDNRNVSINWESTSAFQELLSDRSKSSESNKNSEAIFKKYKLILDYALEPWTREQKPKRIYKTISPEFEVSGDK